VLNQAFDPAIEYGWLPSSTWKRHHFLEEKRFASRKADFLDDVPAMSTTVLGLEMLLHEPCIDLQMASELILSDVGATIQILGLVGREENFTSERPGRMGECIASLDINVWFGAISARTFPCDRQHSATTAVWKHSRLVAQYAQLVAESLDGISPEDAYLVGLLHEIGTIATVLGWPNGNPGTRDQATLLAMEGALPLFVLAAMRSVNDPCTSSAWKSILTAAHELADARPDFDIPALQAIDSIGISSRWGSLLPIESTCFSSTPGDQQLVTHAVRQFPADAELAPSQEIRPPVLTPFVSAGKKEQYAGSVGQLIEARAFLMS